MTAAAPVGAPRPAAVTARSGRLALGAVILVLGGAGIGLANLLPADDPPDPADAVTTLFAARRDGSCEQYIATTTAFFRHDAYLGSATCEAFASEVAEHASVGPVRVRIESQVQLDVDTAEVEAVETYRAGTADEYSIVMAYRVQLEDGAWKVDHVDLTVLR